MNVRHDHDDLLTRALSDLDAAPHQELSPDQRRRAEQRLESILATTPTASATSGRAPARRVGLRRGLRPLGLVAAALALTLAVSLSGLFGTGGTAYASWTAVPTPHPPAEQERIAQECRDQLSQTAAQGQNEDGIPSAADLQASDLVVADSRGAWSYVLLGGANGLHATCLVEESESRTLGVFPRAKSAAGSYGFMANLPEPDPREIIGTGLMAMGAPEGSYWSTDGYIGTEVAAVSVLTADGTRVEATVTGGRFAAWWPQRGSLDAQNRLAAVTYLVTLEDGTELPAVDYDGIGPHWQE